MQDATHPSLHAAGAGSERLKETRPNLSCSPDEVVAVELRNQPGELAHVCELLGAEHINIEYAYSGLDSTNSPVVFFGVKDAGKAAMVLDKIAVAA